LYYLRNMRTPLLASVLLVLVPACLTNEITGIGGGEGDDDMGEGSGSGSGSGSNVDTTPRVTATLDKTTLTTENGKTETITVNLTSENGWAGDVTLGKSLVDAANNAIPNVTVDGPATVTLTADGTGSAAYTITIPSNATGSVIEGSLKVALSSSAGTSDLASTVTINNFYTVMYPAGTGMTATDHPLAGMTINVKRGTIIKWPNNDNITHIIHGGGSYSGEHEDQTAGGSPGRTYDVPTIGYAPGTSGLLGCHSHGTASYATFTLQ
jgi:hypothetical protein